MISAATPEPLQEGSSPFAGAKSLGSITEAMPLLAPSAEELLPSKDVAAGTEADSPEDMQLTQVPGDTASGPLSLLREEQLLQLRDFQETRELLKDMQSKRMGLQFIREQLAESLQSRELDVLRTLGNITGDGEEDDLRDILQHLQENREHSTEQVQNNSGPASARSPGSVSPTAGYPFTPLGTNRESIDGSASRQPKRQEYAYTRLDSKPSSVQAEEPDSRSESSNQVLGDFSPFEREQAVEQLSQTSPVDDLYLKSEFSFMEQREEIQKLQHHLLMLQEYKKLLEAQSQAVAQNAARGPTAIFNSTAAASERTKASTNPFNGMFGGETERQQPPRRAVNTEDLIGRLVDCSVRERLEQASTDDKFRESLQLTVRPDERGQQQRNASQNVSIGYQPSVVRNTDGMRAFENQSREDADHIEHGMEDLLSQMEVIKRAAAFATGEQKQQMIALLDRLQHQMSELQAVKGKVDFLRQAVGDQMQTGALPAMEYPRIQAGAAPETAKPQETHQQPAFASRSLSLPGIASIQTRTRQQFRESITSRSPPRSTSPAGRQTQRLAERPQKSTKRSYPTGSTARPEHETAAWVESAKVDEIDIRTMIEKRAERHLSKRRQSNTKRSRNLVDRDASRLQGLFEQSKDKLYDSAADLISKQGTEPYFLLQLFRNAAKLSTSYARQKLLMSLDELAEQCIDNNEKDSDSVASEVDVNDGDDGVSSGSEASSRWRDRTSNRAPSLDFSRSGPHTVLSSSKEHRRRDRSMAPSPSRNVGQQSPEKVNMEGSMPSLEWERQNPVPAMSWPSGKNGSEVNGLHQLEALIQDKLVRQISRIPEMHFTPAHLKGVKVAVLDSLNEHPAVHRLENGGLNELVGGILDGSLNKYAGKDVVDFGGLMIEEMRDVAGYVLGVTEEEVERSEKRVWDGVLDEFRECVKSGRLPEADELNRSTTSTIHKSSGQVNTEAYPGYHNGKDCPGDCDWDHDALDDLVSRLGPKHEWGAMMEAIARTRVDWETADVDSEDERQDDEDYARAVERAIGKNVDEAVSNSDEKYNGAGGHDDALDEQAMEQQGLGLDAETLIPSESSPSLPAGSVSSSDSSVEDETENNTAFGDDDEGSITPTATSAA
ncbi:uncharacterized protein EV422DRAFT_513088 [Fimicolochytrium jonesii]|uniref:uncharacterized protein n=1 Tax=Fimicolochytrium jonesii TaxID=1396493 RepID=UPI0022FDC112|nr:uncharacterized protein EV422DRAFT_513088 [Fimicolochytrium jonesii]KAI8827220.1 hypothetical protein EV422DRAFT_513088 [Fimicolochytrium jonesii]